MKKSTRNRVCRWCYQPMPDWSDVWPVRQGVYLFYGYPVNKKVDLTPRLVLITVEATSQVFGPIYRTPRSTLKKTTGAAGFFMPLLSPEEYPSEAELEAEVQERDKETGKLKMKRLKKSLSEEFR